MERRVAVTGAGGRLGRAVLTALAEAGHAALPWRRPAYDLGLVGTYSLNKLLNIPRRYGQWHLNGYLYYTDGIEDGLRADSQMWGGAGIWFRY